MSYINADELLSLCAEETKSLKGYPTAVLTEMERQAQIANIIRTHMLVALGQISDTLENIDKTLERINLRGGG